VLGPLLFSLQDLLLIFCKSLKGYKYKCMLMILLFLELAAETLKVATERITQWLEQLSLCLKSKNKLDNVSVDFFCILQSFLTCLTV